MLMVSDTFFKRLKAEAERETFLQVVAVTEEQAEKQRHIELASRFLVHTHVPYDGRLDVEEYIDEGVIALASSDTTIDLTDQLRRTFELLHAAAGSDALRRYDGNRHVGRIGLVGLEGIAVGVARNLDTIVDLEDPTGFTRERLRNFWLQPELATFISPGLRGTIRIQRTVPFGDRWFRP